MVLVNTRHIDDEDGLRYEVTRVTVEKRHGLIVAYRKMVLSDGTLYKRELGPFNVQEIYNLTIFNNTIGKEDTSSKVNLESLSEPRKVVNRSIKTGKLRPETNSNGDSSWTVNGNKGGKLSNSSMSEVPAPSGHNKMVTGVKPDVLNKALQARQHGGSKRVADVSNSMTTNIKRNDTH